MRYLVCMIFMVSEESVLNWESWRRRGEVEKEKSIEAVFVKVVAMEVLSISPKKIEAGLRPLLCTQLHSMEIKTKTKHDLAMFSHVLTAFCWGKNKLYLPS